MNQALIDELVRAVLYEGYQLYPYRPSVKDRYRWPFGGVYPRAYSESHSGAEPCAVQTECLLAGSGQAKLIVKVRFLHAVAHVLGNVPDSLGAVAGRHRVWHEAVEREIGTDAVTLEELAAVPRAEPFAFSPSPALAAEYEQQPVEGLMEWSSRPLDAGLFRVTVRVVNRTPFDVAGQVHRDEARCGRFYQPTPF